MNAPRGSPAFVCLVTLLVAPTTRAGQAGHPGQAPAPAQGQAAGGNSSNAAGTGPAAGSGGLGSSTATIPGLAAVSGGWGFGYGSGIGFGFGYGFGMPYYVVGTPAGVVAVGSPVIMVAPPGGWPGAGAENRAQVMDRGPILPPPPPGLVAPPAAQAEKKASRKDAARSGQMIVFGDRLFRAGNLQKAEERYLQAARLDPGAAAPRLRLAQVALSRENYAQAARRLREAETAQPGWIVTAGDIQALYGEPAEFARLLSRLESHLQVHPGDRDAWLVLGAEWFLSGRTERASNVFLRLKDPRRKPDIALAAFLDAMGPPE